jgi:ribosomal-protein-alanine N-acetyltransferase
MCEALMTRAFSAQPANAPASTPVWPAQASTVGARRAVFAPMTADDLDSVRAVEVLAYAHPWSRKHFADSLAAGYTAMMLLGEAQPGEVAHPARADGRVLLGYLVAMPGVDEMHLLNITVAPAHQRQGWARCLLDALVLWSRGLGAQWLWLEVRHGNTGARHVYERYGFSQVGLRRGYYPAGQFRREDAVVMSLPLLPARSEGAAP